MPLLTLYLSLTIFYYLYWRTPFNIPPISVVNEYYYNTLVFVNGDIVGIHKNPAELYHIMKHKLYYDQSD